MLEKTSMLKKIIRKEANFFKHNSDRCWPEDNREQGGELLSYSVAFKNLLKSQGFNDFDELVAKRRESGKNVAVLDLMGSANFLRMPENADFLLGVRIKKEDAKGKRKIISGNIFEKSGWQNIKQCMKNKELDSFDVIICRPEGPFINKKEPRFERGYSLIYGKMLKEAYSILTRDQGMLFTQIPKTLTNKRLLNKNLEQLRNCGLEIESDKYRSNYGSTGVLLIIKNESSPKKLPSIMV